jgi:hypothetical protein
MSFGLNMICELSGLGSSALAAGFGDVIRLEPDVADAFPDADAVNQALRFLIRITKENQSALPTTKGNA